MSWTKKVLDFLDIRLGVKDLLQKNFTEYLLPRNINAWYALGSVLLTLFAIQFLTGILLLVYYVPNTELAFKSVQKIMNEVPFGWFIRYVHATGANIVILVLFLHMLSILFMAAYKAPRELTWMAGFVLLMIALGMSLTGYLLPWSQLSYWATTVATNSASVIPIIGDKLVLFLRGGPDVGQATLGRFFALHVMGFPLLFGLIVGLHLFLVRRIGVSTPPFDPYYHPQPPPTSYRHATYPGGIPFFPNYVIKDLAVISLFLTLLMTVVFYAPWVFLPPDAFEPADPFSTPVGIKPEWYFLAAYQTLKVLPSEFAGIMAQAAAMLFLFLLPFIDRGHERRPGRRRLFLVLFFAGIIIYIGLTIWGHFS